MENKQIYISDTNHETILLSSYEKEILSTKLFNRLHYISQNSTAYLTFPGNRTKRFEHSIGTMKLCGDIFYNAICNSSNEITKILLDKVKKIINEKIIEEVILEKADQYRGILGDNSLKDKGSILKNIEKLKINNIFYNRCVPNNIDEKDKFLYLVIFQSIRLCGLLHDIGHPPFSHITELSMKKIYEEIKKKKKLTKREKEFLRIMEYYSEGKDKFQLHEEMGNKMVEKLFSQILFSNVLSLKELSFNEKYFKILIFELTKLIFQEEGILKSLHNIIAGSIDGDRLDYVNRDIENSGINNGKIEYDRLIASCKFSIIEINGELGVTYDVKTINTMEDFFMKRWYLYKNIINHHRVSKTDTLLQECLEFLIIKYLEQNGKELKIEDGVLPDNISGLWKAIEFAYSNDEYFDSLIQWDDNWLITILKKHYFKEYYKDKDSIGYKLEEFLSNKKNFYSIIKSNNDFYEFGNVLEKNLNIKEIQKIKAYDIIIKRFNNYISNGKNKIMYNIIAYLEFGTDIGKNSNVEDYIKGHIDNFIKERYNNEIQDSFIVIKKIKTGLETEPVIHNIEGTFELSKLSNIRSILETERRNYPYFYIYFKFKDDLKKEKNFKKDFLNGLGEYMAEKINEYILNN